MSISALFVNSLAEQISCQRHSLSLYLTAQESNSEGQAEKIVEDSWVDSWVEGRRAPQKSHPRKNYKALKKLAFNSNNESLSSNKVLGAAIFVPHDWEQKRSRSFFIRNL